MNEFITIGAIIGSFAQLIFLYNFVSSIFFGKKSVQNPWGSNTLEWTAPVEQIHGNWPGEVPKVYRWPYDYSRPDAEQDFVPQNVPDDVVPVEWAGDPHGAASSHKEVNSSDAKAESVVHFSWFKKLGMRLGVL